MGLSLFDKLYGAPGLLIPGEKPIGDVEQDLDHPFSRDLVARWLMNEGAGDTLYDLVGNRHGILTNGPLWQEDEFGTSLLFDGSDDYILLPTETYSWDDFTFTAWFKSSGTSRADDQTVFAHSTYSTNVIDFGLTDDTGSAQGPLRLALISNSSPFRTYIGSTDLLDQQWHHIACVRANGLIKLFVDGVEDLSTDDLDVGETITVSSKAWEIGDHPGNTEQVDGGLYDIRVYKRGLSIDEIREIYFDSYQDLIPVNSGMWMPEILVGGTNVNTTVDVLTLTEYSSTVNAETNISAGIDTLSLTEYSTNVNLDKNISASVDTLTLTEYTTDINLDKNVSAGLTALTLTPYTSTITTPSGATNVNTIVDILTLTEYSTNVNLDKKVTAGVDALTLSTYATTVKNIISVNTNLKALILTPYAATIVATAGVTTRGGFGLTEEEVRKLEIRQVRELNRQRKLRSIILDDDEILTLIA